MKKKNFEWKILCLIMLAILISIALHIISAISWLNYRETMYIIFVIAKYLFAAVTIVLSVICVVKNAKYTNKIGKICMIIVLLVINVGTVLFLLSEFGMHVTAVSNVVDVSKDENNPYFVVKNHSHNVLVKIQCDKDVRNKIIVDEQVLYEMDYRYIKGRELEAVLGKIDLKASVDNNVKKAAEEKHETKKENKKVEKETETKKVSLQDAFRDKQSVIVLEGEVKFPVGEIQEIVIKEKEKQEKNVKIEVKKIEEFVSELENIESQSELSDEKQREIQKDYWGIDIRFIYKTKVGETLLIHVQSIGANYHIVHVEKQDENDGIREWILVNQSEGNTQKAAYLYSKRLTELVKKWL